MVLLETVDWIPEAGEGDEGSAVPAPQVTLIGSCDLTAVASYCSSNRTKFVNGVNDGVMTRYDCFDFVPDDRAAVAASAGLRRLPAGSAEDFVNFHQTIATSEVTVVSLSAAIKGIHGVTQTVS